MKEAALVAPVASCHDAIAVSRSVGRPVRQYRAHKAWARLDRRPARTGSPGGAAAAAALANSMASSRSDRDLVKPYRRRSAKLRLLARLSSDLSVPAASSA